VDTFLAVRWDGPNQLLGWMELMFGFKPKVQSNNIATGGTSAKESMIPDDASPSTRGLFKSGIRLVLGNTCSAVVSPFPARVVFDRETDDSTPPA
jgi:hypothetical protein